MLYSHTPACAPALVVAFAALTPTASAQLTANWMLTTAAVQHADVVAPRGDTSYAWVDYLQANVAASPLTEGLTLSGSGPDHRAVSLTSDTYRPAPPNSGFHGNRFLMAGTAAFDGTAWSHPEHFIRTSFDFGFAFTGGTVNFLDVVTAFVLNDSLGGFLIFVGTGTPLGAFQPGASGVSLAIDRRFPSHYQSAAIMEWYVAINFDWTGHESGDTLDFFIPPSSVDIQALPTPAGAAALGLALVSLSRRRRA